MAQTSITVPVTGFFEYYKANGSNQYYRSLSQEYMVTTFPYSGERYYLGIMLPDLTQTLGRHLLYRIEATFRIVPYQKTSSDYWTLMLSRLESSLPEQSPGSQYIPAPAEYTRVRISEFSNTPITEPGSNVTASTYGGTTTVTDSMKSEFAHDMLKNLSAIVGDGSITGPDIKIYKTLLGGSNATITVYYDSTEVAARDLVVTGVTSGYLNPRRDNTIGWSLPITPGVYQCMDDSVPPVHETLSWRVSGDSTWNTIAIPDGASSYDIPANTYPTESSIEWKLSVTDADGITTESSVFTITTTDGTSTAAPTAPINSVEIGNHPIRFEWTVSNPTGEAPSRVIIEWATTPDAEPWTTLIDEASAFYSYDAPANTFPGGNIYWRITSYNADGDAGPTSDAVTFSCIAPPSPPTNVTVDSAPFATISWQAEVQTAYEISVDGRVVEKKFGVGIYSYQLKEPLADGTHIIGVRVQGGYGYWSTIATTEAVTANQGAGTIDAAGRFDTDGYLSWIWSGEENDIVFRVYRDGVLIARTKNTYFLDRFVLGRHGYEILAELAGGNYVRSAEISGCMKSCVTRIAPAAGGDWMELTLSENSNSAQTFAWNRSVTLRHYAGAAYPVAEFSPYEDRTATYDCAFKTVAEAKAFEALRGQVVVLKSRGGEVTIGPLAAINKTAGNFYITYQFTVSQIHWEDFIDDTDS